MPYETGVINEWDGKGARDTEKGMTEHPGQGMREALLIAAEQAIATRDHGVVAGAAPPGAEIKLAKQFKTATSPVCNVVVSFPVRFVAPPLSEVTDERCEVTTDPILFDDKLETSMKVRSDGRFEYHANPSTRPFEGKAGKTETFKLTCTAGSTTASRDITLNRGQVIDNLELCGAKGTRAGSPGGRAALLGQGPADVALHHDQGDPQGLHAQGPLGRPRLRDVRRRRVRPGRPRAPGEPQDLQVRAGQRAHLEDPPLREADLPAATARPSGR